jgi:hypothetical protein
VREPVNASSAARQVAPLRAHRRLDVVVGGGVVVAAGDQPRGGLLEIAAAVDEPGREAGLQEVADGVDAERQHPTVRSVHHDAVARADVAEPEEHRRTFGAVDGSLDDGGAGLAGGGGVLEPGRLVQVRAGAGDLQGAVVCQTEGVDHGCARRPRGS